MRKFIKKSLCLMAALLLGVGGEAWADVVETTVVDCNFNNGETLFTGASRMGVTNEDNTVKFTTADNSQNGYSLATYNFSSAIGSDATAVKVEFDFNIPNVNAAYRRFFTVGQADLRTGFEKQAYKTNGSMFAFGLARNSSANYFSINGASTTAAASATNVLGTWAHAEIYVDHSAKTVNYSITSLDGLTTYYSANNVAFVDGSASYCNQLDFFDCQNNVVSYLDNLVITKYVDQSKVATTYTVKYQNAEGTDLKESVVYDTYAGDIYTASSNDMATFYSDDESKKYVYASGNVSATASSSASENVITLVFNEYEKVAYTVTAKNGEETLETLESGEAYTDGSTTVYWNKFKQFDGQWYETTGSYGKDITEAGNTDVAYTLSTITYFVEAEKINKSRSAAANAKGSIYSGGEAQRHYGSSHWWTDTFEEGGYFKLYFPYRMANASASTIEVKTRDSEGNLTETGLSLTASTAGAYSNFVTIPAGSSLAFSKGEYNSNILIDYFALTKINSMSIVGDFSENGWEPTGGIAMTQDSENANIWTAVVTDYVVTSDKYAFQYKAIANQNWSDYVIGNPNASNSDKNQEYDFDYDGARAGVYTLTFTLNTTDNTVELAIEKQKQTFTVAYVDNDGWGDIHAYTFNSETLGGWPGTAMDEYKTIDGKKVYTISFAATDAPANIIFNGNSSQTGDLDFVNNSVYGIAWPTANVTSAGYATFCSPYALDFSDVSGVTAYIASESDKDVSFVEVTSVPAETGVLLKASEGSYSIKPVVNSTTDVTANALVGVLENTEVAAGSFVLMNGTPGVGFYKTTKAFTVGANTAYLPASVSARSFIGFEEGGETTGVSEALSMKGMDTAAPVYNLQGQRVNAPQRGLFIQNGKKYIVK